MMTLWGRKSAFNVQKVMWALQELKIDYDQIEVGGDRGGLDSAEFLKMNPHGKIPVIAHEGRIVWESHSIIRYLGSEFPGPFWPRDAYRRSKSEAWMDWSQNDLQPAFMKLFWGYYRMPAAKRNTRQVNAALDRCEHYFDLLNAYLEHHWYLSGDEFTLGDIPAATSLYRYFEMGINVKKPARVLAWYQRLASRAAYQNTIMTAFDELFAKQEY